MIFNESIKQSLALVTVVGVASIIAAIFNSKEKKVKENPIMGIQ